MHVPFSPCMRGGNLPIGSMETIHLHFFNSSYPLDPNVYEWASGRSGDFDLLIPPAERPTSSTTNDGDIDNGDGPGQGAVDNTPGGDDTPRRGVGNKNSVLAVRSPRHCDFDPTNARLPKTNFAMKLATKTL